MPNESHSKYIIKSLIEHLPFSIASTVLAMVAFWGLTKLKVHTDYELAFHSLHPAHLLFSAGATCAMLWTHEKKILKAFVIGLFGSVLLCGLSDYIMPHTGGVLIGKEVKLHLCVIEEPLLVLFSAILGSFVGLLLSSLIHFVTKVLHSLHVVVSSFASLSYLALFGFVEWWKNPFEVFVILFLSVLIPCCLSDIIFPLLFTGEKRCLH